MLQTITLSNGRTLRYVFGFCVLLGGSTLLLMQASALATQSIEPQIYEIVNREIDKFAHKGSADFFREFA